MTVSADTLTSPSASPTRAPPGLRSATSIPGSDWVDTIRLETELSTGTSIVRGPSAVRTRAATMA